MKTRRKRTTGAAEPRRHRRGRGVADEADAWRSDEAGRPQQASATGGPSAQAGRGQPDENGRPGDAERASREQPGSRQVEARQSDTIAPAGTPVAWRTATGWRVGDEEVSDLTSAMVLADLIAADLPPSGERAAGGPAPGPGPEAGEELDLRKLQETVAQLEHALRVRVRVEQAIGVLVERHRLRPRQAFELLRSAARVRGRRVLEVAGEVVESATNPLLRIPEELAKPPTPRRRGRLPRHSLSNE